MSKSTKLSKTKAVNLTSVQSTVNSFDVDATKEWALNILKGTFGSKKNFVDKTLYQKFKNIDKGIVDKDELKRFFDPLDRETKEGGNAEYMRTDWEPCPLIQSLLNIIKNQIKKNVAEIKVKGTDKISVDKKASEKLRILNKKNMVDNINQVLSITGQPPISYSTDLDKLFSSESESKAEDASSIIAQVKSQASDDDDYTMLSESGMLKDGVEISHEEMISHYREHSNFDDLVLEEIISDYMKVLSAGYRFYTSEINGLPNILSVDLESIFTSSFSKKDASDMDYWGYEFTCTWSDYMKIVGGGLSVQDNKEIYEKAKFAFGKGNWPDYDVNIINPTFGFLNVEVRLGYIEVKKHIHNQDTDKYYDVIKKFYYLPLDVQSLDEKYIIGLGDLQDMHRYGTNLAEANFSLVLMRDKTKMSFYQIMNVEFNRMNKIYNQYLNTFSAFFPEGVLFSTEPLIEMANQIINDIASESGNEVESESQQKIIQRIVRRTRQSGSGILPRRKGDNDDERIDSPTSIIENKILIDCAGLIGQLMTSYNTMLMSLGINPNRLAQEPKPRTTNKSISGASASSQFATMDIEEAAKFALKEFGKRMMYYNQQTITEFDKNIHPISDRAKEMYAIIGTKGVNWLEVYRDMPEQRCVIEIESDATDDDWIMLLNYVNQKESEGFLEPGTLPYIKGIANFKLASLYVIMAIKKTKRERIEQQQVLMEQQQQAQAQQQQAQSQAQQQAQATQAQIQERLVALENQLRTEGQIAVKKQTLENKIIEEDHKALSENKQNQEVL